MTHNEHDLLLECLESFLDASLISEVLEVVKGGKEATVFRCGAHEMTGEKFFAAKVYRPMERRSFRNDTVYQQGRVILNHRTRRAYENKTDFGRKVHHGRWVASEYATQCSLFDAGADVPRPIACNGSAILMEWIGDDNTAAPQLRHADFSHKLAPNIFQRILANIELMLRNNCIHGDLSPFNILYRDGQVKLIDFPQAIDARTNPSAMDLLRRDVQNICDYFAKFGVHSNAQRIALNLWTRFLHAEL